MSNLHPIFAGVLDLHTGQHAQLTRAMRKAEARRFSGEPVTGFDSLPAERVQPPTMPPTMAQDIARLAAEADSVDGSEYFGYDVVREHLEAAIVALGKCGVRDEADIERDAAEDASEARGEAERDDAGSAA